MLNLIHGEVSEVLMLSERAESLVAQRAEEYFDIKVRLDLEAPGYLLQLPERAATLEACRRSLWKSNEWLNAGEEPFESTHYDWPYEAAQTMLNNFSMRNLPPEEFIYHLVTDEYLNWEFSAHQRASAFVHYFLPKLVSKGRNDRYVESLLSAAESAILGNEPRIVEEVLIALNAYWPTIYAYKPIEIDWEALATEINLDDIIF